MNVSRPAERRNTSACERPREERDPEEALISHTHTHTLTHTHIHTHTHTLSYLNTAISLLSVSCQQHQQDFYSENPQSCTSDEVQLVRI